MPKILIVSATKLEVEPLLKHWSVSVSGQAGIQKANESLYFLITGVGMVNTAYFLGTISNQKFDFVINVGICGAFERELNIGEVVNVVSDTLSEMGAEDDEEFIKYEELLLGGTNMYKNKIRSELKHLREIRKVKAITVNKVHGNEQSIKTAADLFLPDIESMEGAAFFRGTENMSDNILQLRAVSNYVEKRDKSKWDIPLAIKNVNEFVLGLITEIKN